MFTVTLTKIDAAQKAKAIKEVKAVQPNMNLVEVRALCSFPVAVSRGLSDSMTTGQEVRREPAKGAQGERHKRGLGKAQEGSRGGRSCR